MDKQEIINKLKDFPYSRDEYWVITGSAMVFYGIREQTHDIDMGCTTVMADQLVADGYSYQLTESKITWPHQTKMFDEVFFWRMERIVMRLLWQLFFADRG